MQLPYLGLRARLSYCIHDEKDLLSDLDTKATKSCYHSIGLIAVSVRVAFIHAWTVDLSLFLRSFVCIS